MAETQAAWNSASADPEFSWYALRTRSNHEKITAALLEARGFEQFLPLYRARRRWTDREVVQMVPLFPGYIFCRINLRQRTPALTTTGAVSIVAFGGKCAAIADTEIEAVRKALSSGREMAPHPYLSEGQRIRIDKGPMHGLEGIFIKQRSCRILISVELLKRSVAVEIDPESITPLTADTPSA